MSNQSSGPGFYRSAGDGQNVIYAPNAVNGPNGLNLTANNHATYSYPIAEWTWYETEAAARSALGLPSWESLQSAMPES